MRVVINNVQSASSQPGRRLCPLKNNLCILLSFGVTRSNRWRANKLMLPRSVQMALPETAVYWSITNRLEVSSRHGLIQNCSVSKQSSMSMAKCSSTDVRGMTLNQSRRSSLRLDRTRVSSNGMDSNDLIFCHCW